MYRFANRPNLTVEKYVNLNKSQRLNLVIDPQHFGILITGIKVSFSKTNLKLNYIEYSPLLP